MLLRFASFLLEGKDVLGARPPSCTFFHASFVQPHDQSTYWVIPHRTNGLVACCALALVRNRWGIPFAANKAFEKNRWMLLCEEWSMKLRPRYSEAIVSSTSCFAAKHPPLYRKHLHKYDVQFRKLIRGIVGRPPARIGHRNGMFFFCVKWKMRVDHYARASGISSWSKKCMIQYWPFGYHIADLLAEHWVSRALA